MEWIQRMNQAMQELEAHLGEHIDGERLGRLAGCSSYHFQRMFGYMAGIPLSEYVRRRRMSRAAADLQQGDKVLEVAARYGYESPTAFNRAFHSVHGVPPSQARDPGCVLRSFPPISFRITVKGAAAMEYRIEKKEAFRIVGISAPLEAEIEKNFETVPALWGRAVQDGTLARLSARIGAEPKGMLGVSACNERAEDWRYYIAVASDAPADGLEEYTVPAFTWAVFPGEGAGTSIQELEQRVVSEWLPTSGYEYANGPDIEVYLDPDPANCKFEVWIPVTRCASAER